LTGIGGIIGATTGVGVALTIGLTIFFTGEIRAILITDEGAGFMIFSAEGKAIKIKYISTKVKELNKKALK